MFNNQKEGSIDEIMEEMGQEFVNFVSVFGYDRILKVLGRHMRDFLNGLDNLHEYMRFSYAKLRPPRYNLSKNVGLKIYFFLF